MIPSKRIVVDTNTIISRLLLPESVPANAVQKALGLGDLLFSDATLNELETVLSRPKFNRYLSVDERKAFFHLLSRLAEWVEIVRPVKVCRDSKDDKFLEVALNGRADVIVSGDGDLLVLNPYLGIPIVSPRQFLEGEAFPSAINPPLSS